MSQAPAIPHYYNLEPTSVPDMPGYVEVECCYLFDWDAFESHHWQELESIYACLPGYLGEGPFWFGVERDGPFLTASVEMVRLLQVYGTLRINDWQEWDASFQALAVDLPTRLLD